MSNTLIFTLDWSLAKQMLICVLITFVLNFIFWRNGDNDVLFFLPPPPPPMIQVELWYIVYLFVCFRMVQLSTHWGGRVAPIFRLFTRDCTIIEPYPAERRLSCQYGQLTLINVVCRPYSGQISKIENNINIYRYILPFRMDDIFNKNLVKDMFWTSWLM